MMDWRRKTALGKISLLGLLSLFIYVPSGAQSVRDLARKTFPSVVLLVMQDANGQPVSLGSGFFVADGIIATNMHVVRGASSGQAKLVGQKKTYGLSGVVAIDTQADLVLLRVSDAHAHELSLGDSKEVAVGDTVYAIGNPEGLEGTFSQGIVSGIREGGTYKLLQITAPISPGSSGGPIIDGQGRVIGVAVATFAEGQNLNFAIPSSYLSSLLKHVGELHPLSSEKALQDNSPSFAHIPGKNSTDGVVGVELAWTGFLNQFTFTLRNQLQSATKDVHFVVVFFGSDGNVLDSFEGSTCPNVTILPMLAKRQVDAYWYPFAGVGPTCYYMNASQYVENAARKYEIRVLDFTLAR